MEAFDTPGHGEMYTILGNIPVIILAINEVLCLLIVLVSGKVKEVAHAIRFLADVVAITCGQRVKR